MSELFYSIVSDRYDTEDGPRDCQILRLFKDKEHYELWKATPDLTRPIDTVECLGGRVDEQTQKYLEWASLAEDPIWLAYAKEQEEADDNKRA
jgi:hypothetical protein